MLLADVFGKSFVSKSTVGTESAFLSADWTTPPGLLIVSGDSSRGALVSDSFWGGALFGDSNFRFLSDCKDWDS